MTGLLIDANLLCLLTVGSTNPASIQRHARLKIFGNEDFDNLLKILDIFGDPILCPQVLAETSNLIAYRERSSSIADFRITLARIIGRCEERTKVAITAIEDRAFARLGLTDAVLLMLAADAKLSVLSDDLALCEEAGRRGLAAINYNHIRDGVVRIDQLQ